MNKIETLNLKCTLSDEEMLAISKEMSEHINKKKQAEDNLSSFSAQLKAESKATMPSSTKRLRSSTPDQNTGISNAK